MPAAEKLSPASHALGRKFVVAMQEALQQPPDQWRVAVVLRDIEGSRLGSGPRVRAGYPRRLLVRSDLHSSCRWKGEASYLDVVVDGVQVEAA